MARRQRKNALEPLEGKIIMRVVVCDRCGERFAIQHSLFTQDAGLAVQQAVWLADKFVWDHIQEIHHRHSIELPPATALK